MLQYNLLLVASSWSLRKFRAPGFRPKNKEWKDWKPKQEWNNKEWNSNGYKNGYQNGYQNNVRSLESTLLSVRPPSSQAAFSSEKLVESTSCCDQRTTPGASSKQKLSQGSNSSSTPRQYPNNWQQNGNNWQQNGKTWQNGQKWEATPKACDRDSQGVGIVGKEFWSHCSTQCQHSLQTALRR